MTPDAFRALALGLPGATEGAHSGHADFRVGGKVFASLGFPRAGWGMVTLTPDQQARTIEAEPASFKPANGAWGRRGSTLVALETLDDAAASRVLRMAWENVARP